jgi:hypothetical protein
LWLNQSQVQFRSEQRYNIETGDTICRHGAAAIRALCDLGVCSHIFQGDAGQLMAWFPPAPSDNLDLSWYVWKVEGPVKEAIDNYKFRCHTMLEPAAHELLDLLENYPETALNPSRTLGGLAVDAENPPEVQSVAEQNERTALGFPIPPVTHSADFSFVCWYGVDYNFTKTQAACVKVLYEAWDNRTPILTEETILEKAGSCGNRLRDVFKVKKKMHPAWGTMIVTAGKGRLRLQEPEKV